MTGCLDCLSTGSQKLTRIEALAFQILASFDILTCSCSECKLTLSINVDLSYTKADCFLNHISGDTCTTVKN